MTPAIPSSPKTAAILRQHPRLCRALRIVAGLLLFGYFILALAFVGLRYLVLPKVDDYRTDIERLLSVGIALPVSIASIDARWHGLRPSLALRGFVVRDGEGRPALALDRVDADIAWTSLLALQLRLDKLEIVAPTLNVRRDAGGRVYVAGLPLAARSEQGGFAEWLLVQHRIVVRDATIVWADEQRGAAALTLSKLNFQLQNDGSRHRFGLTADPPRALAERIDLRGDLRGDADLPLQQWRGEAYAALDHADLAVWRQWIDYPIELPTGSGGLRLWLSVAQSQVDSLTADIALSNVETRLGPELPALKLHLVTGRLTGQKRRDGFSVGANGLALTTVDGINIGATDFRFDWSEAAAAAPAHGQFSANGLDLDALARLAAYLPMDDGARKRLAEAAPRGKLHELALSWSQAQQALAGFKLRARFAGLGLRAQDALPGFEGLSGSIDGSDQGGTLALDSRDAVIEMPTVFADPRLALATLKGAASWQEGKQGMEIKLSGFDFDNRDAAGSLSGSYAWRRGQAGVIDLSARLTRADGGAVWRYMPLVVNRRVRDWLQASVSGGKTAEATLRLKGDLERFPFVDGSGLFEVRGKFSGARLRYAEDWPQIDDISGELAFIGARMSIKANKGNIYGVDLHEVTAQIDDLLAPAGETLLIKGRAEGPTAGFLRFIEDSPVGERIEHFTEDMSATGTGRLDLTLTLPLQHIADSKTAGVFQALNNRLSPGPGLPVLSELNGRLEFTGDSLRAERIRANLLGMPVVAELRTRDNGWVVVNADGGISVEALRRQFDLVALEHLSGSANWHLTARLRGKNAEVVAESKLVGLASSLPEPFNKSALETLPLRFERKFVGDTRSPPRRAGVVTRPGTHEQVDLALGASVNARLLRRLEGGHAEPVLERGAISVGLPLTLPEKGVLVAVRQQKIDLDFWRALLADRPGGAALPVTQIDLKATELTLFGRRVNDLGLAANAREAGWHVALKSRDVQGELDWLGSGAGRLTGHLQTLVVNPAATTWSAGSYTPDELPGLDIEVDRFLLGDKAFGHLKLSADNRKGKWEAKLDIDNEDGKLSGSGSWQSTQAQAATQMQFLLQAKSAEKLLARLGYPDALRRGQATLEGKLTWNGTPLAIDYASLNGSLAVLASAGQFNKLEPGAGRLLGILSLQSLPRRVSLDFRDVFSEGFAFDNIGGQIDIQRGIMSSQELRIQGPAAKILMSGKVDLPRETQDLKVRVQPAIGESLSVGAILLAHPAFGAIAFLLQKLLSDPIDQAFAYEYAVTGTWADPKVEKLSAPSRRGSTKAEREQD